MPFGDFNKETGEFSEEIYLREMNISFGASTGCAVWDAAIIFSRWVHAHRSLFRNQRVLELGSGMGLVGIMAARYCATLVVSDGFDRIRENLSYNLKINSSSDDVNRNLIADTSVAHVDYSNAGIDHSAQGRYDILLGCETVYTGNRTVVEGLAHAVDSLLRPGGVYYMLQSTDRESRRPVIEIFTARGFSVTIRPCPDEFLGHYGTGQLPEHYECFTIVRMSEFPAKLRLDIKLHPERLPSARALAGGEPLIMNEHIALTNQISNISDAVTWPIASSDGGNTNNSNEDVAMEEKSSRSNNTEKRISCGLIV